MPVVFKQYERSLYKQPICWCLCRYHAYVVVPNEVEKQFRGNNDRGRYCRCHAVTSVSVIVNEEHAKQPVSPFARRTACTCVTFQQRMVSDQLLASLWWGWRGHGVGVGVGVENGTPVALSESLTWQLSSVIFWETRKGIIDVLSSAAGGGGEDLRRLTEG